ncbi:regulatory protein [Amphibacillus marinus]|uniref:Regulatory protein RecX n=2 Tax=Amphibacillus marinus TaxID=872970 RepID=A0A1H8RJK0_9BACI|nr:regulatory protein [Amphibacillus marinus]
MKIAKIVASKKRKARYHVYLEEDGSETYGFTVEEDTLINEGLKQGQQLDRTRINKLLESDTLQRSYAQSIRYLTYRMRSIQEVRDYLRSKDTIEGQIEQIINRLLKEKLLDDLAFAKAYVSSKSTTTLRGPLKLQHELKNKGVSEGNIRQALEQYHFNNQVKDVEKWLNSQLNRRQRISFHQRKNKLKQALMQKGFNSAVINQALAMALAENEPHDEWESLCFQGEKIVDRLKKKVTGYELKHKVKGTLYQKGYPLDLIERFIDQQATFFD